MILSQLITGACLKVVRPYTTKIVRNLHRSPDYNYIRILKENNINFLQQFDKKGNNIFYESPKLVTQILKSEVMMKEKGLIPFLHATPSSSKVLIKMRQNASKLEITHFRSISELKNNDQCKIPQGSEKAQNSHLLSLSYALTSGTQCLETAASWGFRNHFGEEQFLDKFNKLKDYLEKENMPDFKKRKMEKKGSALIRRYNRLKRGNFYVIGIPVNILENLAYDSFPYNIPTKNNIINVSQKPQEYLETLLPSGTHMATLVFNNNTRILSKNIEVIDASDTAIVDTLCSGQTFKGIDEIPLLSDLVSSTPTDFEKEEDQKRKIIDNELKNWLYYLNNDMNEDMEFAYNSEDLHTYSDNPYQPF